MEKQQWYLIENETDYQNALVRYEALKYAPKGSDEHKEKLLLVHLITEYEKAHGTLPEIDPIEMIRSEWRISDINRPTLPGLRRQRDCQ
jgi:HTH-type transcriptional regulator/antitoxin HigA